MNISMSYKEAKEFLAAHGRIIELSDAHGARVAICPQWQGRVMTSTCGGDEGESFGFINREFIASGRNDPHFNNYGGEDRMWLSPEGGPFSLWFEQGAEQNLNNWYTPPALNEGEFRVVHDAGSPDALNPCYCTLARRMKLKNTDGAEFDLEVTREIRLWNCDDLQDCFGEEAAAALRSQTVATVAYETVNTISNRGPRMERKKGLVSIWMLDMLNSGPRTVIVAPFKQGGEAELGTAVRSDYFGAVPAERLRVLPGAALLLADAKCRAKIGISQRRARNVIGAVDFDKNTLTVASFTMPADPAASLYMNNAWDVGMAEPYVGDVANAYNDGPPAPGKPGFGDFYEIESLSPAVELNAGESLTHRHCLIHFQADAAVLSKLARAILGVELDEVKEAMIGGE